MNRITSTGLTEQQMQLWVGLHKSGTVFKLPKIRPVGVRWYVQGVDLKTGTISLAEPARFERITFVTLDPPVLVACGGPPPPPPCRRVGVSARVRQFIWLMMVAVCAVGALALSSKVRAYDLQKCQWLDNQTYSLAWLRDAGVTPAQLKVMIRKSDETSAAQVGLIALSRYVYAHRELTPDELAEDVSRECRSYDE